MSVEMKRHEKHESSGTRERGDSWQLSPQVIKLHFHIVSLNDSITCRIETGASCHTPVNVTGKKKSHNILQVLFFAH